MSKSHPRRQWIIITKNYGSKMNYWCHKLVTQRHVLSRDTCTTFLEPVTIALYEEIGFARGQSCMVCMSTLIRWAMEDTSPTEVRARKHVMVRMAERCKITVLEDSVSRLMRKTSKSWKILICVLLHCLYKKHKHSDIWIVGQGDICQILNCSGPSSVWQGTNRKWK